MPEPQLFELVIAASGMVHDKDGNLLGEQPIEMTAILTEDQLRAHLENMTPKETTCLD